MFDEIARSGGLIFLCAASACAAASCCAHRTEIIHQNGQSRIVLLVHCIRACEVYYVLDVDAGPSWLYNFTVDDVHGGWVGVPCSLELPASLPPPLQERGIVWKQVMIFLCIPDVSQFRPCTLMALLHRRFRPHRAKLVLKRVASLSMLGSRSARRWFSRFGIRRGIVGLGRRLDAPRAIRDPEPRLAHCSRHLEGHGSSTPLQSGKKRKGKVRST
jgi:hypothetical protein